MNPELRQTLHTISRNLESANEVAQENIYTFTQLYIDPCLSGFKSCITDVTSPCFPSRGEQLRRRRGRSRGPAELNFDFYDDWDADEEAQNLGWGNDELDTLLAGNTGQNHRPGQPRRQAAMSYGSRSRRKSTAVPKDGEHDPTVIPGSSYLGFLERLPWNIGKRVLRYKPSAADLQVNPGGTRVRDAAAERLMEASDDSDWGNTGVRTGRQRSGTTGSQSTNNSLSSRGDLIPSDEEDDAVPLDDEFAMVLERRMTHTGSEDHHSGKTSSKTSSSKKPRVSRTSSRTVSSKSSRSFRRSRRSSSKEVRSSEGSTTEHIEGPTLAELQKEEEQARVEEETEVERKREAAEKLALTRGLSSVNLKSVKAEAAGEIKSEFPVEVSAARGDTKESPATKNTEQKDVDSSGEGNGASDSKVS